MTGQLKTARGTIVVTRTGDGNRWLGEWQPTDAPWRSATVEARGLPLAIGEMKKLIIKNKW